MIGCGWQAVKQVIGDVAVLAMHHVRMSTPIKWSTFCLQLKGMYIPSNALYLVECKCEELSLRKAESVTEINKHFCRLQAKLDPH